MANHIPTRRVTEEDIESLDDIIDAIRELVHIDAYGDGKHTEAMSYLSMLLVTKPIIGWCDDNGDYHEAPLIIKGDGNGNVYFNPTSFVIHISDSNAVAVEGQPQDAVIVKRANQHFDHIVLNNGNAITYKWLMGATTIEDMPSNNTVNNYFVEAKTMNNAIMLININTIRQIVNKG